MGKSWRYAVALAFVIVSSVIFTLQLTGEVAKLPGQSGQACGGLFKRVHYTHNVLLDEVTVVTSGDRSQIGANGSPSADSALHVMRKKAEEAYARMINRRSKYFNGSLPEDVAKTYYYFAPMYNCIGEERVGSIVDGGKWVCDPTSLNRTSIVYSVGSKGETGFERDLHSLCNGCEIHAFDTKLSGPKEERVRKAETEGIFKFHNWGIGTEFNKTARVMPLKQIMDELGHTYIDLFKIDCEGCEWDLFNQLLSSPPLPIGQILVEVHPFGHKTHWKVFNGLEALGYRMFHYEVNPHVKSTLIVEVSFVHESMVKPL